jgi:hypothetical protein
MTPTLSLCLMPARLAVCRLAPEAPLPSWANGPGFLSVTRTGDELSIVVEEGRVPEDVQREGGFRPLRLEGTFDFSQVGILASVLSPLAQAGISIFAVSTYDTDYVLVKDADLAGAVAALRAAGHGVKETQ